MLGDQITSNANTQRTVLNDSLRSFILLTVPSKYPCQIWYRLHHTFSLVHHSRIVHQFFNSVQSKQEEKRKCYLNQEKTIPLIPKVSDTNFFELGTNSCCREYEAINSISQTLFFFFFLTTVTIWQPLNKSENSE